MGTAAADLLQPWQMVEEEFPHTAALLAQPVVSMSRHPLLRSRRLLERCMIVGMAAAGKSSL